MHCFCVCSRSALLGDLLWVSRSMERDLLSVLLLYPRDFLVCIHYRQDFAKRQTAGIRFTQGQKADFLPAGATRCTDSGQTLQDRRAPGSAWPCKISHQSAQGGGNAAPKYQKFPLFGKESPRRGDSLDRFRNFLGAFIA